MPPRKRPLTAEECASLLGGASFEELPALIRRYKRDPRSGVKAAAKVAERRLLAWEAECARLASMSVLQEELHASGVEVVAGVDEVGRGALAGPVTAAAVILPRGCVIPKLDDSKMLTPEEREVIAEEVKRVCLAWSVAHVPNEEIDSINILRATHKAMRLALEALEMRPEHVLVDGLPTPLPLPSTAIVDGDRKVAAIAAASVVAKVTRDALMVAYDAEHPGYGFARHKGYSTEEHKNALDLLGPCVLHRRSFAPCADDEMTLF